MKKWMTLMATSALALSLVACNTSATPTSKTSEENTSDLTLKQVFEKSLAQSESIESLSADLDMVQKIEVPAQDVAMDTSSKMTMDLIVDPLSMHQKGTTSTTIPGEESTGQPQEIEMESFMTADGFFTQDNMSQQWMKLPKDMYEQMISISQKQADPSQQLKDLEIFMDDFTFNQDDKEYVLKLSASGEKFNELIQKQLAETMPELGADEQEMLKELNIKKVDYEIHIDKETFNTTALNVVMDMTMAVDGEEMTLYQDMKSTFSNYNGVKKIVVPQEVLDTAQEM
ncbi:hypothetical protein HMPREF1210_03188 [Paenisporosarcina sp. HGH0030]|uniref:DUF6612 family protein n=1 Tax=Paenisporosarcina sp. HGH0030 TaxID=1078085 RepID=UPI00034E96E6|nr:DUF6612 family protein [Paenisporosarcina sp. HGH0030]EPD49741.1 hypothetical protein HMPREF1210_03188 [Paenisporosarcina sp. HGH0030]